MLRNVANALQHRTTAVGYTVEYERTEEKCVFEVPREATFQTSIPQKQLERSTSFFLPI